MKLLKQTIPLLLLALTMVACNKVTCTEEGLRGLEGNWAWESTEGGMGAHLLQTPASTGIAKDLRLTANGHYALYTNGTLAAEGSYAATVRNCIHTGTPKQWLLFSDHPELNQMVENLNNGLLVLSDEAHDGLTSRWTRTATK